MMRDLRTKMDQAVQDTIAATRIIDAFKSPHSPQQGIWLKTYAGFPLEYVLFPCFPISVHHHFQSFRIFVVRMHLRH